MNPDMLKFIRDYDLISPGDQVICALSGGMDSMYLLHQLMGLQAVLQFRLSAAHFNHNLRGDESNRDEAFVRDHCLSLGIPLFVGSGGVVAYADNHHMGLEEAARDLRYEFLLGLSSTAKIATAHNAQDNLETLLLHLIRGCGLHGLTGIPPKRDRIIRPMLLTDRETIVAYLEENRIPHVEDSSNQEDFCLRNRLRHHVLPLLTAENPNLPRATSDLCLQLLEEETYLEQAAYQELHKHPGQLFLPELLALPKNLQPRVMQLYLQDVPQLQRKHIVDALALGQNSSPSAKLTLPGGYVLRRQYDRLILEHSTAPPLLEPVSIAPGETVIFGSWQVHCHAGTAKPGDIALKGPGPFTLRCRQPGDRISLPGGTKKLSRYLIDKKIPAAWRDGLPVVLSCGTLAAVLPLGADVKFSEKTGNDSLILTAIRMEDVK